MVDFSTQFPEVRPSLRRVAAKLLNELASAAPSNPTAYANAAKLVTFFNACAAAATAIGKPYPAVTLSPQGTKGPIGSTQQLTFTKGGSSGAVSWKSSNPAVATVNASGLVTRVSVGWSLITARVAEGTAHKARDLAASVTVV